MYSLALHTQGTLVGIGVSVAAAHRRKVQRAGQDRLHVRAVRLQKETTKTPHRLAAFSQKSTLQMSSSNRHTPFSRLQTFQDL